MKRKSIVAYILESGNRREIEVQREDKDGRITIRRYQRTVKREYLMRLASASWRPE